MKAAGKILRRLMLDDGDVRALAGTRIRQGRLNRGDAYPAVSYKTVFTDRAETQAHQDRLVGHRMQIDVWSESIANGNTLLDRVRRAVGGKRNTTVDGETLAAVHIEDQGAEIFHDPPDGSDVGVWQLPLDVTVWYLQEASKADAA